MASMEELGQSRALLLHMATPKQQSAKNGIIARPNAIPTRWGSLPDAAAPLSALPGLGSRLLRVIHSSSIETSARELFLWRIGPPCRNTTSASELAPPRVGDRVWVEFSTATCTLSCLKNPSPLHLFAPHLALDIQRAFFFSMDTSTTPHPTYTSMEPSHHKRAESHGMEAVTPTPPSPTIAPEQATGRTRVRFSSSAAEIPPPPARRSCSRISESSDGNTGDVEELLNTHNTDVDADARYSVTGAAQGGVFYQLLQAYKTPVPPLNDAPSEASTTSPTRPLGTSSGAATPSRRKWYDVEKGIQSQETLATLIGASAKLANPNTKENPAQTRPTPKRTSSGGVLAKVWKGKEDKDARIKVHVAIIIKRQQYIVRMCRALMLFGAPTHRLEEYLAATAKVLEINSQFLYIPGCMIISFDDVLTQ
jgi:hypothetical protein